MRYHETDRYDDPTFACPICGEEGECSNPDACYLALENLRLSLNDAPPNNPEEASLPFFDLDNDLPF